MLRIGYGQHVDSARSLRFVASDQSHIITLANQRVAMHSTKPGHGTHAPREDQNEAASQEGAQTRRSRVQDATTIAAGAARPSKCMDALRPGDITLIMRRA